MPEQFSTALGLHFAPPRLPVRSGTDTGAFLEALYRTDACTWGTVADAFILEENGTPVAGASGYVPTADDYRILNSSRLTDLASALNWSAATAELFWQQYEAVWGTELQNMALKPQASWMIEFVAVMPEARGRGLVKGLLNAVLEAGRQQGHSHAGIMVVNGNDWAQRAYEALGFKPYVSFAADYFDDRFSGLTRLRMRL